MSPQCLEPSERKLLTPPPSQIQIQTPAPPPHPPPPSSTQVPPPPPPFTAPLGTSGARSVLPRAHCRAEQRRVTWRWALWDAAAGQGPRGRGVPLPLCVCRGVPARDGEGQVRGQRTAGGEEPTGGHREVCLPPPPPPLAALRCLVVLPSVLCAPRSRIRSTRTCLRALGHAMGRFRCHWGIGRLAAVQLWSLHRPLRRMGTRLGTVG